MWLEFSLSIVAWVWLIAVFKLNVFGRVAKNSFTKLIFIFHYIWEFDRWINSNPNKPNFDEIWFYFYTDIFMHFVSSLVFFCYRLRKFLCLEHGQINIMKLCDIFWSYFCRLQPYKRKYGFKRQNLFKI